ncbi:MAG: PhzF family phenazine biosynthesis protein [Halovenus sp.]
MSRRFAIVDVFARQKYAGNQLGVVTDATDLTTEEMQAIAAEIDYSETTFVTGEPAGGGWPVRIFTPTEELPFAGHPTLGTAAVIRDQLADGQPASVTLDLPVGQIPVDVRERDGRETLWMKQNDPEFGDQIAPEEAARVLGLDPGQIASTYPVQAVSTGLPAIVVPLVDRGALETIDLDRQAYDDLVGDREAKLVHAFCADPREADHDVAARMFAPYYGVPEDPATGSANGCLAGYLSHHEYFGSSTVDVRVEQGYEMGRPSLLYLEADRAVSGEIDVEVGGSVVPVARGE